MKKKSGFSLVEVIVGVSILTILIAGIVTHYTYLKDKDYYIDNEMKNVYFNDYLFNLVNIIDLPDLSEGNKFYLVMTSDNSFSVSLDPSSNKNTVGFFLNDDNGKYYHSIEYIEKIEFKTLTYNIYKIYSYYNDNEKTSYIIK